MAAMKSFCIHSASSVTAQNSKRMEEHHEEVAQIMSAYHKTWVTTDPKDLQSTVVIVQPHISVDVRLKFQLNSQYPASVPDFSLLSGCLTKSEINHLQRLLDVKAFELTGYSLLTALLKEVEAYIQELGLLQSSCHRKEAKRTKKDKTNQCDGAMPMTSSEMLLKNYASDRQKPKKSRKNRKKEFDPEDDSLCETEEHNSNLCDQLDMDSLMLNKVSPLSVCDPEDLHSKRPTHFIAVRILNEEIVAGLKKVQQELVEKEPLLENGIFTGETFHLTLCTLELKSPMTVAHCISTLTRIEPDLKSVLPQTPLTVYSISQFYNRAIYSKVKFGDNFAKFQHILREQLVASGVGIIDEYNSFTPHVTIIKVKRPERKKFGNKNIKPSLYSHLLDKVFGQEYVSVLYLCCMDGQRREDGFYNTLYELTL